MSAAETRQGAEGDVSLSVDRVVKSFGDARAVDDVSLKVRRGEFVTLLGPSGCGKTTLLNLIAGFLAPESGEIFIDGAPISGLSPFERNIGVVFQNYALFPHMTVAENVGFGLKMRKVGKAEVERRVQEALEMVRLPQMGDRRPRQLSGGQQQRIALARALVIRPQLILLDEPFSAIDKNLRAEMQVELKTIQRQVGITTIFVTHDQSEALSMSDRIAVMSQGRVQQLSEPIELYRRPANSFVASFIGEINRLACTRRRDADCVLLEHGAVRLRLPAARVPGEGTGDSMLYVRPEALRAVDPGTPEANLCDGTVDAQVYQGTHVDLIVKADNGWLLRVREPGFDALERWPVGARLGVHADLAEACVY
ncbi:MAG: ABC transporter ATP-binding protein [bacterium]|jgi:spermidine/putrescine ABC transporter ATP-binding subunit|nr:ABC transporter ATP-binding protein [Betaproteobacteria bacterium]